MLSSYSKSHRFVLHVLGSRVGGAVELSGMLLYKTEGQEEVIELRCSGIGRIG